MSGRKKLATLALSSARTCPYCGAIWLRPLQMVCKSWKCRTARGIERQRQKVRDLQAIDVPGEAVE